MRITAVRIAIACVLLFLLQASAAANNLDSTFDLDGIASRSFLISPTTPTFTTANAIQADGKIVFAGVEITQGGSQDIVTVLRFNTDGSPDMGFGSNGSVSYSIGFFEDVEDMKIQPDGKILISGSSFFGNSVDFWVLRLNTNGTTDTSFDGNGLATADVQNNSNEHGGKLALQPDGKIIVAGGSDFQPSPFTDSIAVVRFQSNGAIDPLFHGDGRVTVSVNPASSANAVDLQSDNKIIVCGYSKLQKEDHKFTCLRLDTNGNVDFTFGTGLLPGMLRFSVGSGDDTVNAVTVLPDNSMIVAGEAMSTNRDIGIAKITPAGLLDTTFGSNGIVVKSFTETSNELGYDIASQTDGKFVVLTTRAGGVGIVRFNADGSPDGDLGIDGVIAERMHPTQATRPSNLAIQSDGKFVVSGITSTFSPPYFSTFFTARFLDIAKRVNSAPYDFDGDGMTDISIYRRSLGGLSDGAEGILSQWWILNSSDRSNLGVSFGLPDDIPVPADFTGDGITDIAFFRLSTGEWYVLRSDDRSFYAFPFGAPGDIPAPGDYDGDGIADAAVYRPSTGQWFIVRSSDSGVTAVPFGIAEDKPVVADYDGDGQDDIAVFRPSVREWWILNSGGGVSAYQFGSAGDQPVRGDFTGDGKNDVSFFRPSTGEWFVLRSEDLSFYAFPWGQAGDVPVPGDYDGDGTTDAAVWREQQLGTWYVNGSTSGYFAASFGATGDVPLPDYRAP